MKRIVISSAVLALAIGGAGVSQANSGFKVTGGGQAVTEAGAEDGVKGPGDTYGFNAQDLDGDSSTDAAKGQFNSIQRNGAGPGKGNGEHIKGEVTCLVAVETTSEQGAGRFGGVVRGTEDDVDTEGNPDPLLFAVEVTDNGEGQADDDTIVFQSFRQSELDENENACDMEPVNEFEEIVLARGNVQVHNYTAPE